MRKLSPISPFVGFQHATVETLERFRWWCFLRNRRRTEADEDDQERGNIDLRMRIRSIEHDAFTAASSCPREAYQRGMNARQASTAPRFRPLFRAHALRVRVRGGLAQCPGNDFGTPLSTCCVDVLMTCQSRATSFQGYSTTSRAPESSLPNFRSQSKCFL